MMQGIAQALQYTGVGVKIARSSRSKNAEFPRKAQLRQACDVVFSCFLSLMMYGGAGAVYGAGEEEVSNLTAAARKC